MKLDDAARPPDPLVLRDSSKNGGVGRTVQRRMPKTTVGKEYTFLIRPVSWCRERCTVVMTVLCGYSGLGNRQALLHPLIGVW